ncbi:MAG: hypothetical protein ACLSDQ_00845 [Adlercreutzia equolifaciens]
MVILQKRERAEVCEPEWAHTERVEAGIDVNPTSHPTPTWCSASSRDDERLRAGGLECRPKPGTDLEEALREALGKMTARIPEWDAPESEPGDAIPADPDVRDWSYAESGGALYFRMGPHAPAESLEGGR